MKEMSKQLTQKELDTKRLLWFMGLSSGDSQGFFFTEEEREVIEEALLNYYGTSIN